MQNTKNFSKIILEITKVPLRILFRIDISLSLDIAIGDIDIAIQTKYPEKSFSNVL